MKKIKVSIVEDLHEIREGIKTLLLHSTDFEFVSSYTNAEDAVLALTDDSPDIVIMDINLPGISGIDCIKKLKDKGIASQFMMFTVYDDDENIFKALQAGASGYILKKTPPHLILSSVKEIFDGGSPMSTQIARRVVQVFQTQNESTQEASLLTAREKQILDLLSKGHLYKEIADQLSIAIGTVKQHLHKVYEKLHVQNKTEAINKVFGKRHN
jgi:DNA-binding NarL/FixJ family response regulator